MKPIDYAGLMLKNPVIVASATPSITVQTILKAAHAGAGAVVTKSVIYPEADGRPAGGWARPRFQLWNSSNGYNPALTEKNGHFSLFRRGEPYPTPEKMERMLEEIRKVKIDIPIIVSICGSPTDYETWRTLAKRMENAGADAIELNMHAYPEHRMTDPLYITAAKSAVKIPVIAKLMAINDPPEVVGPKVEIAGADAVAALGTFGFRAIELDVENRQPFMGYHGLGGTWLRAVSLAYVSGLANTVHIPISGVTGIQSWQDAVKYILLGATTVQICGAIYARGYKVITEVVDGLEKYMQEHDYDSITEFRGAALKNIQPLEYAPDVHAEVDPKLCVGCGKCAELCFFDAIEMNDKKAHIKQSCDGCGLCASYCPRRAITMKYGKGAV